MQTTEIREDWHTDLREIVVDTVLRVVVVKEDIEVLTN